MAAKLSATIAAVLVATAAGARAAPVDFVKGADFSSIGSIDCDGACPKFKWDGSSAPSDAVQQLAKGGINTVRIRLWNNPTSWMSYSNITGVLQLAKRVHDAGMQIWLDFHYSDTWADPGHQGKPAAWEGLSTDDLVSAVYNFTFASISALVAQGTPPMVVQPGNEIDNGLLWNGGNQPCSQGGRIASPCQDNWPTYGRLVGAGQKAIRDAAPDALIAIQSYKGSHLVLPTGVQEILAYFHGLDSNGAGDYDVASFSFYPESDPCPCNLGNWSKLADVAAGLPGKRVAIAETSYPWEDNTHKLKPGQFPYTQAGQAQYVQSAIATMRALPNGEGFGVVWWGTEITGGYGLGLTALWDEQFVGTQALRMGWQG